MDWDKQIYEWKEILDKIDCEVDFFQKIKDGVSREDMKEFLHPYDLFLTSGMCRIVLISNHLDTVIKISDDESNGVDYNSLEISNYEKALRDKVDKYFCKCESLGTRDKFSIEIMEKVEPMNEDEISEELAGAKKYLQKHLDSNDIVFQQMANDELKHAEILIKKAYSKLPNAEEKTKLKSYEDEINQIKSNID